MSVPGETSAAADGVCRCRASRDSCTSTRAGEAVAVGAAVPTGAARGSTASCSAAVARTEGNGEGVGLAVVEGGNGRLEGGRRFSWWIVPVAVLT